MTGRWLWCLLCNSFCRYSACCIIFDAIMFTVIFFSLKVFFWAALVNSGLVLVGLGTSGQSRLSKLAGLHRS